MLEIPQLPSECVSWHHTHRELTWISHCEVSRWDHNELTWWAHRRPTHSELTATTAWRAHWDDLANSSLQAHGVSCKLMESSQQAHSVSHLVSSMALLWCKLIHFCHYTKVFSAPSRKRRIYSLCHSTLGFLCGKYKESKGDVEHCVILQTVCSTNLVFLYTMSCNSKINRLQNSRSRLHVQHKRRDVSVESKYKALLKYVRYQFMYASMQQFKAE